MVSINAFSGTAALRSLQATSKAMSESQVRISTGLKVNQASDNPAAWAAATQIRSTVKANSAYSANLSAAQTQTKLTSNALGQMDEALREIRAKVDEWDITTDATKKAAIVTEISNLQKNVTDMAKSAKYNGKNWLENTSSQDLAFASGAGLSITVDIAAQIYGTGSLLEAISVGTGGSSSSADKTLLNFDGTSLTQDVADIKTGLDGVITAVGNAQTAFGAASEAITSRQKYLSTTNDILSGHLSELVDADLDEEAAKLSALQVRQQLATTALQIINQSQLNVLRLFQ